MSQNIWSRLIVGTAVTFLVIMAGMVVYCAGWFGGVGAGYAARISERGNRVVVVKDGVEIPDRPPTAEERLMASQLGADRAFNVDDKRVVARIGGEWFRYERQGGRLVLELGEKKQD